MISVEEVRKKLDDRRLYVVAKNLGISYSTLYDFHRKKTNMSLTNFEKLVKYLEG